ncbi:MAG: ATP-binding protein [Micropruina sp.]|uniref:AAA family ATPase n=1 Tax=Micropruina sp. TaxID=2737536 RepID=UPI0039E4AAEE
MAGWITFAPDENNPEPTGAALEAGLAAELAANLNAVLAMAARAVPSRTSATARLIEAHLGVPVTDATVVGADWPLWRHASVQRAVDAYLGAEADWFGLAVPHAEHQELSDLLHHESRSGSETIARPQWVEVAVGPDTMSDVVKLGLVTTQAPDGSPLVLCLRLFSGHGDSEVRVELLVADPAGGGRVLQRLRELTDELDVLRGQVVSFGISEHYGNQLVSFLPRPDVRAEDVVLPADVLTQLHRHVLGIGARAARLGELGVHLKRGLLLYGPPGTGKTHTVRHLIGRADGRTVIVLSGQGLGLIEPASALARRLAPSVVVVEDVDLIAQDRGFSPDGNPLLFSLLDAMDGVAADADVTFLLTTNRVADLEEALVQRPGRVDLAIEIPRPDAAGRERLFRLYTRGARLDADLTDAVAATEGVTASAIKELMRRAILAAVEAGTDTVTDAVLSACLADFFADDARLTRALVGAEPAPEQSGPPQWSEQFELDVE